ncbi:transcriptional activator RfaH [Novosphingobium sp. MW5]|nr:transcriptional activator RfaH [Novosphingobium sp. MW5]
MTVFVYRMIFNSEESIKARALPARETCPEPRWYVAETLPQEELRAIENVKKQGFEVFFPRFRKVRRHARKRDVVLAPVFPGYVFVRMDVRTTHWTAINSTRGVKRLLGFGRRLPQAVDPEVIEDLICRCDNGIMKQISGELAPGDRVVMNTGPFADFVATIQSLDTRGRVNILFEIMGGSKSINVPSAAIRPAAT